MFGFFNFLSSIFKKPTDPEPEPGRKRRGDEFADSRSSKLRCVEGTSMFDDNHCGGMSFWEDQNRVNTACRPGERVPQVLISKWNQNGKENCRQFLHPTFNSLSNSIHTMDQQNHLQKDDDNEILVVEEFNSKAQKHYSTKKSKGHSKLEHLPFYNGMDEIEVIPAVQQSCPRKEVEVLKILRSPQASNRIGTDIQVLKECTSTSKDECATRNTPLVRKPFKTLDPSTQARASSTPIVFTSRRLVHSPQQQETEPTPSTSMANRSGLNQWSHYRSQNSLSQADSVSTSRSNASTLSLIKRAEGEEQYCKIIQKCAGVERPLPFRMLSPNGPKYHDSRAVVISPNTSNLSQRTPSCSPMKSRFPKSLQASPSPKMDVCDRVNVPVEKSVYEPSTSASRQQSDEADLQILGYVKSKCPPKVDTGPNFLDEILAKYHARDKMREAEEQERKCRLLAERNRLVEEQRRVVDETALNEQIKAYLQIVEEYKDEKEEVSFALPELTPEMEAEIDKALSAHPDSVLASAFNLTIKGRDMRTLKPLAWLNDEVINFYMNLLIERGKADNYPSVHAFNTFFFPKLIGSGYDSLKRWTKKVDIFSHDYLLVPVHRGMHWCMAIINMKEKVIRYYDSMDGRFPQCLDALLNYLQKESLDKKKQPFDVTGWKKEHAEDIPQQQNGSDCGMFACMYAEYVSRNAPITFTQDDMPYFRRKVVYEILKAKLLC